VEVEKKGHSHNDKGGVEQCFVNGLTLVVIGVIFMA
jgi:hypothetical protein